MTGTAAKKKRSSAKSSATTDAQRRAAVILEVLAGIRTAQEAARLLKISPNSYYIVERKALSGLVTACEPAPRRGPTPDLERQVHERHGSGDGDAVVGLRLRHRSVRPPVV